MQESRSVQSIQKVLNVMPLNERNTIDDNRFAKHAKQSDQQSALQNTEDKEEAAKYSKICHGLKLLSFTRQTCTLIFIWTALTLALLCARPLASYFSTYHLIDNFRKVPVQMAFMNQYLNLTRHLDESIQSVILNQAIIDNQISLTVFEQYRVNDLAKSNIDWQTLLDTQVTSDFW